MKAGAGSTAEERSRSAISSPLEASAGKDRARSWIEVSEESLQRNFQTLTECADQDVTVMAIVKAKGYGHGAERCALALAGAGARWFGVGDVKEGGRLRRSLDAAGHEKAEILVVCGLMPEDAAAVEAARLTPVVWTAGQVQALAGRSGVTVHVELETGMGRQGCRPGDELDLVLDAIEAAGVRLGGVMTHFCQAEIVGSAKTLEQQAGLEAGLRQIVARGLRPEWVHAGSSSSLDNPSWDPGWLRGLALETGAHAMVRCGIALYGYCTPLCGGESVVRSKLRPALTWKTRVLDVHEFGRGDTVGYDSTFVVSRPMKLALLPVGYADGVRRSLSSTNADAGGWVMIRGERAPIVGRISMNLTMADVTGIADVAIDDEVILLGAGVTADDHARLADTISYEILCGIRGEAR